MPNELETTDVYSHIHIAVNNRMTGWCIRSWIDDDDLQILCYFYLAFLKTIDANRTEHKVYRTLLRTYVYLRRCVWILCPISFSFYHLEILHILVQKSIRPFHNYHNCIFNVMNNGGTKQSTALELMAAVIELLITQLHLCSTALHHKIEIFLFGRNTVVVWALVGYTIPVHNTTSIDPIQGVRKAIKNSQNRYAVRGVE